MNKTRRSAIANARLELENISRQLSEISDTLAGLRDEEQEYYDNMPEGLQSGDKGTAAEAAIDALNSALDEFPDIESITSHLEDAEAASA